MCSLYNRKWFSFLICRSQTLLCPSHFQLWTSVCFSIEKWFDVINVFNQFLAVMMSKSLVLMQEVRVYAIDDSNNSKLLCFFNLLTVINSCWLNFSWSFSRLTIVGKRRTINERHFEQMESTYTPTLQFLRTRISLEFLVLLILIGLHFLTCWSVKLSIGEIIVENDDESNDFFSEYRHSFFNVLISLKFITLHLLSIVEKKFVVVFASILFRSDVSLDRSQEQHVCWFSPHKINSSKTKTPINTLKHQWRSYSISFDM